MWDRQGEGDFGAAVRGANVMSSFHMAGYVERDKNMVNTEARLITQFLLILLKNALSSNTLIPQSLALPEAIKNSPLVSIFCCAIVAALMSTQNMVSL